jgi:hypothetical protein
MRKHGRTGTLVSPPLERDRWDAATSSGADTLPETVDDAAQRLAAQEAGRCIAQILDVTRDREVVFLAGDGRADADVALVVHAALEWDVLVARAVHDL